MRNPSPLLPHRLRSPSMRPDIFLDLDFSSASNRAAQEGKLLVVDATAAWCGPCRSMDKSTWSDPQVIAWVERHAVAIQIDVDAQEGLAGQLAVRAIPTIITFVDGGEFDRITGATKPYDLLVWLDGVLRREPPFVVHRAASQVKPADMGPRLNAARELLSAGRYDEALTESLWLWEHILEHDPAKYGVRMSYLARDLEVLAGAHPGARAAIGFVRDRSAPPLFGPIEVETFHDWARLNRVMGESARTLAWYDALAPEKRARLGSSIERSIIPLLVEAGRWRDAGALYQDPLEILEQAARVFADTTRRNLPVHVTNHVRRHLTTTAAQLVRALRAATRDADATVIDRRARELDASDEMASALEQSCVTPTPETTACADAKTRT